MKSFVSRSLMVLILFCPLLCGQQGWTSVKTLLDDIHSKGAETVVKNLNQGKGSEWKQVIHHVEGGLPAWLDVGQQLLAGTDAGRTTDLYFALSIALTRNASGVLSRIGPNLPIEKVCSVPYIEPDEKTIRSHRMKVRSALRKVTASGLDSKKKDCLQAVEK